MEESQSSFVGLFKGLKDDNVDCKITIKHQKETVIHALDIISIGNDSVELITDYTHRNEELEITVVQYDEISTIQYARHGITLERIRTDPSQLPTNRKK